MLEYVVYLFYQLTIKHKHKMENFTIQEAIKIQQDQLLYWKKVLLPHVYNDMVGYCNSWNESATKTNHVKRGTELDQWLHNYMINL